MSTVPAPEGAFIQIYQPRPDVFAGPDGPSLKAGQRYDDWIPNDHTFVQGPDGRWHCFGITGPDSPHIHEAEWQAFHVTSPTADFAASVSGGLWEEHPKVLTPAERPGERNELWAPFVYEHGGVYHMFYGPLEMRRAVSKDLFHWEPKGAVFSQEGHARDPWIHRVADTFHMVYVAGNSVFLRTSRDLVHWSEAPTLLHECTPPAVPESPMVVRYEDAYYLFWTIHDGANGNWDNRTYVFRSERPDAFVGAEAITMFKAHAPELVRLGDGRWFVSSVEWPVRGVSVAPLAWNEP